jgi:phenylpropionate dioxygenase-like ring-hydroxylating dioxygenase large terminal subunit
MNEISAKTSYLQFLREYPTTTPGTKGGEMLRQYWHPVCLSKDLKDLPYGVRMLGEDLVAFRANDGRPALLNRRCPHRCASLEYGQVKAAGLMCSYHGWTFDGRGNCVDMPLEPVDTPLKKNIHQTWYPTAEWGGVVWCYMGADKETPPPLPKIDILARTDGEIILERGDIRSYSYLNFLENFVDMPHVYVLHMLEPRFVPEEIEPYCDTSVDTNFRNSIHRSFETHFGIKSVIVSNTADPDVKFVNSWCVVLPTFYRFGGITAGLPPDFTNDRRESGGMLRIIDDTHFEMFRYTLVRPGNMRATFYPRANESSRGLDTGMRGTVELKDYDFRKYPAWQGRPPVEDLVIQETQGAIPPHELEHLASSDIGVALLRRIWRRSMEDVAQRKRAKAVETNADGLVEIDTYKGFAKLSELKIGPENMPDSRDGRGLIRDREGKLVFA